ncbi:hypothetical protein CDV36_012427 [Fusarium kuroshium]|uniref:Uncharacterized protein n=1 Tax=Fusarium kuroshium TaxID=2010991 RepID=A0A3M2RRN0_9HYPO|nr:hypothetical protein CDV36_012427 [Fusarium kuroshium]
MNLALDCGVAEELGSQPLSGPGAKHLNDDAIARDAECDATRSRRTMIWTGKVRSLPEHDHRRSSEDAMTPGKDEARPPEQCRGDPGLLRLLQSAARHVQCLYVAVMANTSGPGKEGDVTSP